MYDPDFLVFILFTVVSVLSVVATAILVWASVRSTRGRHVQRAERMDYLRRYLGEQK